MSQAISVGTDLIDVARIKKLVRRKSFLERIFTPEEAAYCKGKQNAAQHFAVRFAAKEAVWKAFASQTGLKGISHREIGVKRAPNGQPSVALSRRLKKHEKYFSLSLSHTKEYALAVAIYNVDKNS